MPPELIKDVVTKIMQGIQERGGERENIVEIWQSVAGRKVAQHTKPVYFKAGTLVVNVDRTNWLYELNLCKPLLFRRLKKKFPLDFPLRELRFRIGAI